MFMFQSLLACHPGGIHSHTILNIPEYISDEAKSLLKEVSLLHCGLHRPGYLVLLTRDAYPFCKSENSITNADVLIHLYAISFLKEQEKHI